MKLPSLAVAVLAPQIARLAPRGQADFPCVNGTVPDVGFGAEGSGTGDKLQSYALQYSDKHIQGIPDATLNKLQAACTDTFRVWSKNCGVNGVQDCVQLYNCSAAGDAQLLQTATSGDATVKLYAFNMNLTDQFQKCAFDNLQSAFATAVDAVSDQLSTNSGAKKRTVISGVLASAALGVTLALSL